MEVRRGEVVAALRRDGQDGEAERVEKELPEVVDTDRDREKLSRIGASIEKVIDGIIAGGTSGV